jgi:hypothetical protein
MHLLVIVPRTAPDPNEVVEIAVSHQALASMARKSRTRSDFPLHLFSVEKTHGLELWYPDTLIWILYCKGLLAYVKISCSCEVRWALFVGVLFVEVTCASTRNDSKPETRNCFPNS